MKRSYPSRHWVSCLVLIASAWFGSAQRAVGDTTFTDIASLKAYGINADFEEPALPHVDTAEATTTANIGPGWRVNVVDGTSSNFGVADPNQTFYPFQSPGGPLVAPLEGRQYGFVKLDAAATADTLSKSLGTIKAGQNYGLTVTIGVRGGSNYGLVYEVGLQTLAGADIATLTSSGILSTPGALQELTYNLSSVQAAPFVGQEAVIVIRGHNVQPAGAFSQANFDNVRVTGTFGDATFPTLTIDRTTGNMTLTKTGPDVTGFVGYELSSAAGSFNQTGWQSIADAYDDSGNGTVDADDDWTELTQPGASTDLAESQLTGTPNNGGTLIGSINLGNAWTKTPFQDVSGRLQFADGTVRMLQVQYTGTAVPSGDLDGNGLINVGDWTLFKSGQGSNFTGLTAVQRYLKGDLDNDGDHDLTDFIRFRTAFDAANGAGAFEAALAIVPEPGTTLLLTAGALVVTLKRRQRDPRRVSISACMSQRFVLALAVVLAGVAVASATAKVDRLYSFGDDPLEGNPAIGSPIGNASTIGSRVGWTLDSVGPETAGGVNFSDLQANGSPVYASAAGRPGAAPGSRAASFDGSDDYLQSEIGSGFNLPALSPSSTMSPELTKGTIDWTSIVNRGFQTWIRPNMAGMGTLQHVVHDMDEHGFRISAGGNWEMRYNSITFNSGIPVEFDEWHHVMLVIPHGTGGAAIADNTDGAVLYVNGNAVGAIGGGYDLDENTELVVGASLGTSKTNFYNGLIDDLELFAWGRTALGVNHGRFNLGQDNAFVKSAITTVAGDVNRDGMLSQADVDALVAGWRIEKVINNVRVGDLTTFASGDLNFDGITDLRDAYLMIQALPGAGSGSGINASVLFGLAGGVPEPSSLLLLTICASTILATRPRRRRA
jgi:hypothetical protein